jgi:hypothetical protein
MLYAHEKPDFEEQPERAPEGIDAPPWFMRKLAAEMVFFTLTLAHCGHLIISRELIETNSSKWDLQSLQTYS